MNFVFLIMTLFIASIKINIALRYYCNDQDSTFCLVEDFAQISDFEIVCDYQYIRATLVLLPSTRLIFDQQIKMINCSFETVYRTQLERDSR